ncbi:hypothetical protein H7169_03375 [Candidatus Gracilibacteria bacterium]|nr:hypothetical protein [Candidatus Gracilibacteria bacterium]
MPLIQSPLAFTLPWYDTGIPSGYWQTSVVPGGKILLTTNLSIPNKPVDTEYLSMMAYSPAPGSVRYTGDMTYPQFSENGYIGQCVAFAKAVSDQRSTPSSAWKPGMSLIDYINTPQARDLTHHRGMMIASFDGKSNYSLALANRKHVAILLGINWNTAGKPTGIIVADQNYYSYAPYLQYMGKIAKHTIPWGHATQSGVGYARCYHIVNI